MTFQKSKGCSQCCEGTLILNDIQADCASERENHESAAFYECDKCGFRVKEFADGRIEMAGDDEWNEFCQ
jgi:hypothetical protein